MIVRDRSGAGDASVCDNTIIRRTTARSGVGEKSGQREIASPRIKLGLSGGGPGFFLAPTASITPLACDVHLMSTHPTAAIRRRDPHSRRNVSMLYWAAVFFIIALIAGLFGFGGIAGGASTIAQILFVVFVVLFLISLVFGRRGRSV